MTKTPEELTEEWLNYKLQAGSFWFVETEDNSPKPMVVDIDGDFDDYSGNYYVPGFSKGKLKVLAPCNYDEYKAMQDQIADASKKVEEMKAELAEHRHYCCCAENEVMRLKLAELEEKNAELKKWCEEFNALNVAQENKELRALLRECLPIVSAEIMTWQIRGGEKSYKRGQDLLTRINAALGESEEHPDMLKNADNFNTSTENVKENNR